MKLETLMTRYKNLGYTPKGLERDLEIASIIKWIYETHDIYIDASHVNIDFDKHRKTKGTTFLKFYGFSIWNTKEKFNNRFSSDNFFNDPFDAKFDMVRHTYRSIKFQKY